MRKEDKERKGERGTVRDRFLDKRRKDETENMQILQGCPWRRADHINRREILGRVGTAPLSNAEEEDVPFETVTEEGSVGCDAGEGTRASLGQSM